MKTPPLVSLRTRTTEDFDALYEINADLDSWEERDPRTPSTLSRERYQQLWAATDASPPRDTVPFVIDVAGRAIGYAVLFDIDSLARHAEVGIGIVAEHRSKGYGTEALGQLVEFGFTRCNLRRLHLEVLASNTGAIRSYTSVGFEIEGHLKEHAWVRGQYEDMLLMGLMRSDWAAARG